MGIKFIKDLEWLVFIVHLASEIHLYFWWGNFYRRSDMWDNDLKGKTHT